MSCNTQGNKKHYYEREESNTHPLGVDAPLNTQQGVQQLEVNVRCASEAAYLHSSHIQSSDLGDGPPPTPGLIYTHGHVSRAFRLLYTIFEQIWNQATCVLHDFCTGCSLA